MVEEGPCIAKVEKTWFQGALQHDPNTHVSRLDIRNGERTRADLHEIVIDYCINQSIPCKIHSTVKLVARNHFFFLRCVSHDSRQQLLAHGHILHDHQAFKCSLLLIGNHAGRPISFAIWIQIELVVAVMIKPLPLNFTKKHIICLLEKHLGKDNIKSLDIGFYTPLPHPLCDSGSNSKGRSSHTEFHII